MSEIEERLTLVRYVVDKKSHIEVDSERCADCVQKPCLFCCPAQCFTSENETVHHSHQGCLECGACRLLCPWLHWTYPRGGYGVSYRS